MLNEQTQGPPTNICRSILWWGYFGTIVVLFGLTLVSFALTGFFDSIAATVLSLATLSFDLICIAGLYSYIRSPPLAVPAFWRVMLTLLLAKGLVSASFLLPNLFPWESGQEQYVSLAGLLSLIWLFPMIVALWQYAFKSQHIWSNAARPSIVS
jgi:hypothetical protein